MFSSIAVPIFMFGTLGIVFVTGIIIFARFWRKRSNRHPMKGQRERNIGEIRRENKVD